MKLTGLEWLALLLKPGCSSGPENQTGFPSRPEAKNVRIYDLKQNIGRQVSSGIDAEYPYLTVAGFYTGHVKEPWVPCFSGAEWLQLINDGSDGEVITVHQVRLHWAIIEQDRELLLGVRYASEGKRAVDVPDNSGQKADLIGYQEANVTEVITRLGLVCEGAR